MARKVSPRLAGAMDPANDAHMSQPGEGRDGRKRADRKRGKVSYQAYLSRYEAVSYFEAIVAGLKRGEVRMRHEGEAVGGRRGAGEAAIARLQQRRQRPGGALARAHLEPGPHQVANHVAQEARALDPEVELPARLAFDVAAQERAHGGLDAAPGRPKRRSRTARNPCSHAGPGS